MFKKLGWSILFLPLVAIPLFTMDRRLDPNIVNLSGMLPTKFGEQYSRRQLAEIDKIIVHHSATTDGTPYAYALYHINENGWPGIGYHFVIDRDGTINQTNNLDTISYHTSGQNRVSLGVCLTGDFDKQQPTAEQKTAFTYLVNVLREKLGYLPLYGHRDFSPKSCPGTNLDITKLYQNG
jgi:N-acetylmuramoyl-L-alanine amidase